ncbi:hypothetical protein [Piscirickettsia litoralis]|nr:hypothetical protein [Piscirickettsia litoralis]
MKGAKKVRACVNLTIEEVKKADSLSLIPADPCFSEGDEDIHLHI